MSSLSKAKFILYLVAIFVAGGVTGAIIAVRTEKQIMAEPPRPERFEPRLEPRYLKERFQTKLGLTPEQSTVIEPILEKMSQELKTTRMEATKRCSGILKTYYDQIARELTAEQRLKLDEMSKDRRENSHRRFHPSPESFRKSNAPPPDP